MTARHGGGRQDPLQTQQTVIRKLSGRIDVEIDAMPARQRRENLNE
jgi:hypothetical protein